MLGRESEGIWRDELRACANQVPNLSRTRESLVHVSTLRSQAEGRGGKLRNNRATLTPLLTTVNDSWFTALVTTIWKKAVRILGSQSPIHGQHRRLSGLVSPSLRFHTDKLTLSKALVVEQRERGVTVTFLG